MEGSKQLSMYEAELEEQFECLEHYYSTNNDMQLKMMRQIAEESHENLSWLRGLKISRLSSLEQKVLHDDLIGLMLDNKEQEGKDLFFSDGLADEIFEKAWKNFFRISRS
jgi:hypothetical protein